MVRSTTSSVLKSYGFHIQRSTYNLNTARNTVLTGRSFNSFAESPAVAARSFQLRRSFQNTESQLSVSNSVVRKFEVAWSTIDSVLTDVNQQEGNSALTAIVKAGADSSGAGRNTLGASLIQKAESIIQTMNAQYGENFVFAGSDALNVPFEWDNGKLTYRGVDVGALDADGNPDAAALEQLQYLATGETKYADIGLGLTEDDATGELMSSSAFNVSLSGINFLGYGTDEDGDPKNIASIIYRMGKILTEKCDENGKFQPGAFDELQRLMGKFDYAASELSDRHVELDTRTSFLKDNQELLENNKYNLNEQISELEDVDLADAITAYSWAQYCYNTSLKVGNSILSESLMDYLNT